MYKLFLYLQTYVYNVHVQNFTCILVHFLLNCCIIIVSLQMTFEQPGKGRVKFYIARLNAEIQDRTSDHPDLKHQGKENVAITSLLQGTAHSVATDSGQLHQDIDQQLQQRVEEPSPPQGSEQQLHDKLAQQQCAGQQMQLHVEQQGDERQQVEQGLGQQLEQGLGQQLEQGLDQQQLEQDLGQQLEQGLGQQQPEQGLGQQLELGLSQQLEQGLGQQLEQGLGQQLEQGLGQQLEQGLGQQLEQNPVQQLQPQPLQQLQQGLNQQLQWRPVQQLQQGLDQQLQPKPVQQRQQDLDQQLQQRPVQHLQQGFNRQLQPRPVQQRQQGLDQQLQPRPVQQLQLRSAQQLRPVQPVQHILYSLDDDHLLTPNKKTSCLAGFDQQTSYFSGNDQCANRDLPLDESDMGLLFTPVACHSLSRDYHYRQSPSPLAFPSNEQQYEQNPRPTRLLTSTPNGQASQALRPPSSICPDCIVLKEQITALKTQMKDQELQMTQLMSDLTKRIEDLEKNHATKSRPQTSQHEEIFSDTDLLGVRAASLITGRGLSPDTCKQLVLDLYDNKPPVTFTADTIRLINERRILNDAPTLSKWAVFELFSLEELVGRNCLGGGIDSGNRERKRAFDQNKMKTIKAGVFQVYPQINDIVRQATWMKCVEKINTDVLYLFKKCLKRHAWLQVGI